MVSFTNGLIHSPTQRVLFVDRRLQDAVVRLTEASETFRLRSLGRATSRSQNKLRGASGTLRTVTCISKRILQAMEEKRLLRDRVRDMILSLAPDLTTDSIYSSRDIEQIVASAAEWKQIA